MESKILFYKFFWIFTNMSFKLLVIFFRDFLEFEHLIKVEHEVIRLLVLFRLALQYLEAFGDSFFLLYLLSVELYFFNDLDISIESFCLCAAESGKNFMYSFLWATSRNFKNFLYPIVKNKTWYVNIDFIDDEVDVLFRS